MVRRTSDILVIIILYILNHEPNLVNLLPDTVYIVILKNASENFDLFFSILGYSIFSTGNANVYTNLRTCQKSETGFRRVKKRRRYCLAS